MKPCSGRVRRVAMLVASRSRDYWPDATRTNLTVLSVTLSAQIMATGGLLQWANGIRLTMATDPGRALFKEQVQMHGFSFLDDYLDNILLNVKQE